MNRRIFCSEATCASKADSISPSITFSEPARRPISVSAGAVVSTRREKSPSAMAPAVLSTRSSGRKARVTKE